MSGSISLEKAGPRRSEGDLNKIGATTKGCCTGCQIFWTLVNHLSFIQVYSFPNKEMLWMSVLYLNT